MARTDRAADYRLEELSLAFPSDLKGYRYRIERSNDRLLVGRLEGNRGAKSDPVAEYMLVDLVRGPKLEFLRWATSPETALIPREGRPFGLCRGAGWRPLCGETSWELKLNDIRFGEVDRDVVVTTTNLCIVRPDGSQLPLRLGRDNRGSDLAAIVWRLLTPGFIHEQPPPNTDWVVSGEALASLSKTERLYYFAVSLLFRASIFGLEYS